jgi:hypothetical protein
MTQVMEAEILIPASLFAESKRRFTSIRRPFVRGLGKTCSLVYSANVNEVLSEHYGEAYFPFAGRYDICKLPGSQQILFANISFPQEIRTPTLLDVFGYGPFASEAQNLLNDAHARVKVKLKAVRARK